MTSDELTIDDVARLEGISRRSVERQLSGIYRSTLVAREVPGPSGKMRKMVLSGTMSLGAQQRYAQEKIAALVAEQKKDSGFRIQDSGDPGAPVQPSLLPVTDEDKTVEQVKATLAATQPSQIGPVLARYRAIQPLMNHDFAALGLGGRTDYENRVSGQLGISRRHLLRLAARYKKTRQEQGDAEAIQSLAVNSPGPGKWSGSPLDPRTPEGLSNTMYIRLCWEAEHLTRRQTYRKLVDYLETKQRGTGGGWVYQIPSEGTVLQYINRPEPHGLGGAANPRRNGPEALKAAAGYIDCTYDDEAANDTWCIDEWELDGAFYNAAKRREVFWSIYLVSVIDERTTRILDWTLAYRLNIETVLDLLERCVRAYGPPLYLRSDQAGHFRGRVLERGKPAGPTVVQGRGKLLERVMGALGNLGVQPVAPEKHNPRSNRIERMHGIYADRAQRDFGPSWRGSKKKEILPGVTERDMSGIDDRVTRHISDHCKKGICGPLLLSTADAERIVARWIEEINLDDTNANGCQGMSRFAAYSEFKRPGAELAARGQDAHAIDLAFAERCERQIRAGGVVEWRDGLRYSNAALIGRVGEALPMLRYRREISKIYVEIDGVMVSAEQRVAVGRNDPERLAEECERLGRLRKELREQGAGIQDLGSSGSAPSAPRAEICLDPKSSIPDPPPGPPLHLEAAEPYAREYSEPSLHEIEEFTPEMEEL